MSPIIALLVLIILLSLLKYAHNKVHDKKCDDKDVNEFTQKFFSLSMNVCVGITIIFSSCLFSGKIKHFVGL